MEEKSLNPFIFMAGIVAGVGIIKSGKFIQPAAKRTRVFLSEKKEHLTDLWARTTAKKVK